MLWLLSSTTITQSNLRHEASKWGIAPERLIFCDVIPIAEHLARHRLADLFLDTLPVNAHTTASDALWAGLPVLTCAGEAFVGRVAGSLLHAVGMAEMVTSSLAEYEAKAFELVANPKQLFDLKKKLVRQLPVAPLFDIAKFTRDLENVLSRMWTLRQAGNPR